VLSKTTSSRTTPWLCSLPAVISALAMLESVVIDPAVWIEWTHDARLIAVVALIQYHEGIPQRPSNIALLLGPSLLANRPLVILEPIRDPLHGNSQQRSDEVDTPVM
jgi:hypothetical protein